MPPDLLRPTASTATAEARYFQVERNGYLDVVEVSDDDGGACCAEAGTRRGRVPSLPDHAVGLCLPAESTLPERETHTPMGARGCTRGEAKPARYEEEE